MGRRGELRSVQDGLVPVGPLVLVRLADEQEVQAVVLRRRREPSGWSYLVALTLYARTELADGRVVFEPDTVEFWAPGDACTRLEGQSYTQVPTDTHAAARVGTGRALAAPWRVEEGLDGRQLVHRPDCAAPDRARHVVWSASDADVRAAVRKGAAPCYVCRPDRAQHATP
jgi:hypothetical protein